MARGHFTDMKIFLLLCSLSLVLSNKYLSYLTRYGYLQDEALTDNVVSAVRLFQRTYNLKETGVLDKETEEFMDTPRCGNRDELLEFNANPNTKWHTNTITWHMFGGKQYDNLIERAFDVWGRHANLTFLKDSNDPTITLSLASRKHVSYSRKDTCYYEFDGPGIVLAHAFLPHNSYNQTDIHFDKEENWDYSMDLPQGNKVSFFLVAVHEIGHALGLSHSFTKESAMWAQSQTPKGITNLNEYDLSSDDILAIQFLYGRPPPVTKITTTSTTTSTTTESTTVTESVKDKIPVDIPAGVPESDKPTIESTTTEIVETDEPLPVKKLDICTLKQKIDTFIILKDKIFAFYNEYVWIIHIDPAKRNPEEYTHPKIITYWLSFLPKSFKRVSAIYQRPNGQIAIVVDNDVFFVQYPELFLNSRRTVNFITGRKVKKINALISNNQGASYMLIDDWYIMEIDECMLTSKILGITSNILHGIPGNVKSGFRYTNGRLYFLTESSVLEYDEFTNTVTRSESEVFEVLKISCMRETLIQKLYDIVKFLQ